MAKPRDPDLEWAPALAQLEDAITAAIGATVGRRQPPSSQFHRRDLGCKVYLSIQGRRSGPQWLALELCWEGADRGPDNRAAAVRAKERADVLSEPLVGSVTTNLQETKGVLRLIHPEGLPAVDDARRFAPHVQNWAGRQTARLVELVDAEPVERGGTRRDLADLRDGRSVWVKVARLTRPIDSSTVTTNEALQSGIDEHEDLRFEILRRAVDRGLDARQSDVEPRVDISWIEDGCRVIVEVKSVSDANVAHQVRLGIRSSTTDTSCGAEARRS